MASTSSSREAALERRKALTSAGKKAEGRYSNGPVRVRTAADAKPARSEPRTAVADEAPPRSVPQRSRPAARSGLSLSAPASPAGAGRGILKPIANPSRELVLARREALSRRGKRADSSKDRTRTDLKPARTSAATASSPATPAPAAAVARSAAAGTPPSLGLGSSLAARNGGDRRNARSRSGQYNPSRALVLARRDALSKRGKSASIPGSTSTAAVARQGNPDLSTRDLAQKVRELKSRVGSAGSARNGGCRPCGPNRNGSRQEAAAAAAADAHWKVGSSVTSGGQVVTGTQANRSTRTTGNEASTCRPITGTEYLGAEIFNTFCQSGPLAVQPAKVRVTSTSHGNVVTGNEVGRSEKVTGDEPGTCKNVTGTEYISANQSAALCGVTIPAPRKVGLAQTVAGRPVSGVMVGRSERVTGDEPGSGRHLTGTQYVNEQTQVPGRAPTKVSTLQTLRGTSVTGTHVGRSEYVTGDEPGSCRLVTGDEYVGSQQYERFCGVKPAPEPAKVGFSVTNRNLVVSGTRTGRSEKVTGDEPGTCKAVTGTPYAGMEDVGTWCSTNQVGQVRQRTPVRMGTVMSGIQPGIGGVMTGAERGACEDVTGTPYVGPDQLSQACGTARQGDADFPQPLDSQPWQQFSVQSPARAAQLARQRPGGVTGTRYEKGSRITGPFDLAGGKVTGTEEFRFDRGGLQLSRGPLLARAPIAAPAPAAFGTGETGTDSMGAQSGRPEAAPVSMDEDLRPTSRVTGEGISAGLRITGDDWDRGRHVTGTEGASARRRNPSRSGPMTAMPSAPPKRNDQLPEPVSRVTGSSGNTMAGSLITVSGGARG